MITAEAVIDLGALKRNYAMLKSLCHGQKVVAVIKGNAYGHNAVKTAQTLSNADMFAVSRIEEAIELRNAGIPQPILLLEGCFCAEDLQIAAENEFQISIHSEEQLIDLEQTKLAKPVKTWLKIDTGMHRLGVQPYELADFVTRIEASQKLTGPVGFMSHFCCADDKASATTKQQLDVFLKCTEPYPGPKTLANSAGILYWETSHFDYCRAGIVLYGISPTEGVTGKELGFEPVMTLKTKLIAVRNHQANQSVGYGETWTSERDTKLGVIAMGYGDGFPRCTPAGTPVFINGRLVPIVGRVSMDMITVDLGPQAQDKVGDSVEMWGDNLPVEQVAESVGTIPYELVIKLANRIKKTYIPK